MSHDSGRCGLILPLWVCNLDTANLRIPKRLAEQGSSMAKRFVRVDLSDASRDYRPIAVEPGVPMLDKSNAHNKILFRWLGGLAADPAWEGESVNFYVRDDHGGRLEEVACEPIAIEDLDELLKDDFAALLRGSKRCSRKPRPNGRCTDAYAPGSANCWTTPIAPIWTAISSSIATRPAAGGWCGVGGISGRIKKWSRRWSATTPSATCSSSAGRSSVRVARVARPPSPWGPSANRAAIAA